MRNLELLRRRVADTVDISWIASHQESHHGLLIQILSAGLVDVLINLAFYFLIWTTVDFLPIQASWVSLSSRGETGDDFGSDKKQGRLPPVVQGELRRYQVSPFRILFATPFDWGKQPAVDLCSIPWALVYSNNSPIYFFLRSKRISLICADLHSAQGWYSLKSWEPFKDGDSLASSHYYGIQSNEGQGVEWHRTAFAGT